MPLALRDGEVKKISQHSCPRSGKILFGSEFFQKVREGIYRFKFSGWPSSPDRCGKGAFPLLRSLCRPWLRSLRDFGPFAVLAQGRNTPQPGIPLSLRSRLKPILDRH